MKNIIFLTLLVSCNHLFYHPTRKHYTRPDIFGEKYQDINFQTLDGIGLHGWYIYGNPKIKRKEVILYVHGNAENISTHFQYLSWLRKQGYDVFIFDYRGFGKSGGEVNPINQHLDVVAAIKTLSKKTNQSIIVYGHSIGGILLLRALEEFQNKKIKAAIFHATFSSYQNIAFDKLKEFWPTFIFSPLAYLLISDKMAPKNMSKLDKIPKIVIHGIVDQIVPYSFGRELYAQLGGEKWFITSKNGNHGNIFYNQDAFKDRKIFQDILKQIK